MKKLTGFIILWVVIFSILWGLDESGLFSYRTIEIFFGEELSLPPEYATKQVDIAELGKKSRSKKNKKRTSKNKRKKPRKIKKNKEPSKNKVNNLQQNTQKQDPIVEKEKSPSSQQVPDHILPLYKRGEFYSCLYNIKEHIKSSGSNRELDDLAEKCQTFVLLTEDFTSKTSFNGKITIIKMTNGKEYIGKVIANGVDSIDFKSEWGSFPLPKNRIAAKRELDSDEFRKELSQKFNDKKKSLKVKDYRSIMIFIRDVHENNMPYLIVQAVERLESQNSQILDDLVEYKASKIYRSYLWCRAMGQTKRAQQFRNKILDAYSRSRAAKEIRSTQELEPVRVAKRQPVKENLPRANGAAAKLAKKANSYYSIAYKHLKKSFPGEPNSDKELAKAKKNFKAACDYYQRAIDLQPNNVNLQKQLQQSMEYYHHCIKQTRLE